MGAALFVVVRLVLLVSAVRNLLYCIVFIYVNIVHNL